MGSRSDAGGMRNAWCSILRWEQQRMSLGLYAMWSPFYAGKGLFSWYSRWSEAVSGWSQRPLIWTNWAQLDLRRSRPLAGWSTRRARRQYSYWYVTQALSGLSLSLLRVFPCCIGILVFWTAFILWERWDDVFDCMVGKAIGMVLRTSSRRVLGRKIKN